MAESRREYSTGAVPSGLRGVLLVKIVVGLGNPGREYAATRHNLGFMVVDELARRLAATERRNRFRSDLVEVFDGGEKVVLLKPRTYMNLSGSAVREAVIGTRRRSTTCLLLSTTSTFPSARCASAPKAARVAITGLSRSSPT